MSWQPLEREPFNLDSEFRYTCSLKDRILQPQSRFTLTSNAVAHRAGNLTKHSPGGTVRA